MALPLAATVGPRRGGTPVTEITTPRAMTMREVYSASVAALHRFVHVRAGGDAHLVDDIMQQLWLAASRGPALPRDEAEAWLRGAAKNLLATHWRKLGRRAAAVPLADPVLAEQLADEMTASRPPLTMLQKTEARSQLLLALTDLPSAEQDLLARHYFSGQNYTAIAADLAISERAVEGRLYRARQSLRDRLKHLQ
jgi:RNA polymerase sigma factor (sigma-70 family)